MALPVLRMLRRRQGELIKRQVEPAPEFEAGLADGAGADESEFFVQTNAREIFGVNAADQHVNALLAGPGNDP